MKALVLFLFPALLFAQDFTGLPNDGYGAVRVSCEQILGDTLNIHYYENNVSITAVYMVIDSAWSQSDSLYIKSTDGVSKTTLAAYRISESTGTIWLLTSDKIITDKRYIQIVCPATGAVRGVLRFYFQWKNIP